MIDVPNIIRECRRFRHLTQKQLADRSGVSRQTIWNVERDNNNTMLFTFEKLLEAMGFELVIREKRK